MIIRLTLAALVTACSMAPLGAATLRGTPISSTPAGDSKATLAFDGDPETYFQSTDQHFAYCGLDLGKPHVITRMGIMPRNNASGPRNTLLGMVEGANSPDFSDAIPLHIVSETPKAGMMTYADISCSLGVRYVRYTGPEMSHCQVAELEFQGTAGEGDMSRLWQITDLPTVVINTRDFQAPYDKVNEIACNVVMISDKGTTYFSRPAGVRERGNASRNFPKKPWRLKFEKKTSLLDAPAEAKKWTLINNYGDKSLMRNILAFEVAKKTGMDYVPYCRAVDVVMNGEYKGCYQLCDQVDVRENRVDITEMAPEDIEGEALTGGYFLEVDGYASSEPVWFETPRYKLPITVKSPGDDAITPQQLTYIRDYMAYVESTFPSGTYGQDDYRAEPAGIPYREVFDTPSFIRHMLVNEVAGNTDTYWSTYLTKERNDPKIHTGPVWDFDLGFDNDVRTYHVWVKSGQGFLWDCGMASAAGNMRYLAQRVLLKDPATEGEIRDIWAEARENGLSAEWLIDLINSTAEELDASQRLNFMRWPILDQRVHQNPQAAGSYEGEIAVLTRYAQAQMDHLDRVIGYEPPPVEPGPDPEPPVGGIDDAVSGRHTRAYAVCGGIAFRDYTASSVYEIHRPDGSLAARGTCGGSVVNLPAGLYVVRLDGTRSVKIAVK